MYLNVYIWYNYEVFSLEVSNNYRIQTLFSQKTIISPGTKPHSHTVTFYQQLELFFILPSDIEISAVPARTRHDRPACCLRSDMSWNIFFCLVTGIFHTQFDLCCQTSCMKYSRERSDLISNIHTCSVFTVTCLKLSHL